MIKNKITAFADWFCKSGDKHPTLAVIICITVAVISALLVGGWVFVYQTIGDNDWTKSDSVIEYSTNMFAVVIFGFLMHAALLFFVAVLLGVVVEACYYGWFIVLPLLLLFLSICFGRWLYIRRLKPGEISHIS